MEHRRNKLENEWTIRQSLCQRRNDRIRIQGTLCNGKNKRSKLFPPKVMKQMCMILLEPIGGGGLALCGTPPYSGAGPPPPLPSRHLLPWGEAPTPLPPANSKDCKDRRIAKRMHGESVKIMKSNPKKSKKIPSMQKRPTENFQFIARN